VTVEAPDIVIAPPLTTFGKRLARPRAMARYLAMAVITLVLISFIAFAAMNRSATEAARNALGRGATGEQLQTYVAAHRLDRPLVVRYLDWLGHYLRGEWGSTVTSNLPVKTLVLPAFRHTAELALASLLWSLPVAIALGVFMARRGGVIDRGLLVIMTVLAALPEFVVGLAVMILLAVQLRWFPVDSGAVTGPFTQDWLKAFALPSLTLGLGVVPYVSRIARAAVSESLGAPFTRNAVLRGLPRRRVVWRHAMRSAAVPLVNAIAINIIYLMGGVVIVENVFAFPGLGRLLIQSIGQGDTNLALSIIVLLGAVFIALGLVADVVVTYLNPRLKAV
jgi:peptide/nickel transport system permease protein